MFLYDKWYETDGNAPEWCVDKWPLNCDKPSLINMAFKGKKTRIHSRRPCRQPSYLCHDHVMITNVPVIAPLCILQSIVNVIFITYIDSVLCMCYYHFRGLSSEFFTMASLLISVASPNNANLSTHASTHARTRTHTHIHTMKLKYMHVQ